MNLGGIPFKAGPHILCRGLWKAGVRVESHSFCMTLGGHLPVLFLGAQPLAFLLEQFIT